MLCEFLCFLLLFLFLFFALEDHVPAFFIAPYLYDCFVVKYFALLTYNKGNEDIWDE